MTDLESYTPLAKGDQAPDFELFTHDTEPWHLSEHLDRPTVLLFFPGAFTSVCTTELNSVNNDLDAYDNAHVVGISTDSPFVLSEFRSVNELEFLLLSDHDASVCAQYGAKYEGNFTPMDLDRVAKRAAFVVNRDRRLQYAEVLENAGKQPDFGSVKETLQQIRT
jgi:peroxiredoxin